MRYIIAVPLIFLASASITPAQNQANSQIRREISVEDYSVKAFLYTRSSGSIILSGACQMTSDGEAVEAGTIGASEPLPPKRIDEIFNDMTKASERYKWSRSNDGLLHVQDDRAVAAILKLRFQRLDIKHAVSLRDALEQVLSSREVKMFLDQNHLQMLIALAYSGSVKLEVDHLRRQPDIVEYTHTFNDLTLEEVLNDLAQVFPGVWIYSECPGRISIIADPTGLPRKNSVQ